MERAAVVVALVLCGATAMASAGPDRDGLLAIELAPVPRLPLALMPLDGPASVALEAPGAHDIDMLERAPSRRADRLWRAIDIGTLAVSAAALVVDWQYTRTSASSGWSRGRCIATHYNKSGVLVPAHYAGTKEAGLAKAAIGARPSTRAVDAYFAAWLLADAAIWALMPGRWRSVIPGVILGVEVSPIAGNATLQQDPSCLR